MKEEYQQLICSIFYGLVVGVPFGAWQRSVPAGMTAGAIIFTSVMMALNSRIK